MTAFANHAPAANLWILNPVVTGDGTCVDADIDDQWAVDRCEMLDYALSSGRETTIESHHYLVFFGLLKRRMDFTQLFN
ncbi:hypothetical protein D3C80_1033620 [compost metagenome]